MNGGASCFFLGFKTISRVGVRTRACNAQKPMMLRNIWKNTRKTYDCANMRGKTPTKVVPIP